MKHTCVSLLLAVLVGLTTSSSHAGGVPMQQIKAKISGTVETQVLNSPSDGQIAKTKLDNARIFAEFAVSPDVYALVFNTSVGLELVPKSSMAKLDPIVVVHLGSSTAAIDTHKGTIALSAPVDNVGATGNLFQDFVGEAQGAAKFKGTFPPSEFTKITLEGFARGHDNGGNGSALVSFKITASGTFEQTP